MIRIHETHTQDILPGSTYKEQNGLPVIDAVVALTAHLDGKFTVEEARFKRLILKVGGLGPSSIIQFTGSVEDMRPLLVSTFIYAVFKDNFSSQGALREVMQAALGDRDAFQDHLIDLQEAGNDWKVIAFGIPLGLTEIGEMQTLYEQKFPKPVFEIEVEPPVAPKESAFRCEAVD